MSALDGAVVLLALNDDHLVARLGDELLGDGLGVTPDPFDRKRRFAARWLDQWLARQREAICGDPRVVAITSGDNSVADLEELAVIIDVLRPVVGAPLSPRWRSSSLNGASRESA